MAPAGLQKIPGFESSLKPQVGFSSVFTGMTTSKGGVKFLVKCKAETHLRKDEKGKPQSKSLQTVESDAFKKCAGV